MIVLVAVSSLHAMLLDIAAAFSAVQDPEGVPDSELPRIVFTGLMESTRPGAMAGIFVVLALCLVAVGVQRDGQRQMRAA